MSKRGRGLDPLSCLYPQIYFPSKSEVLVIYSKSNCFSFFLLLKFSAKMGPQNCSVFSSVVERKPQLYRNFLGIPLTIADNGQRTMENEKRTAYNGQRTKDGKLTIKTG